MIIGLKGDPDAFSGTFMSNAGERYRVFGRYAPGRFTLKTLRRETQLGWRTVPNSEPEFHRIAAEIKEKLDEQK